MNGIFALFSLNAIMCIGGIDAIFCLLACNSFMSVLSVVRKIRQGYKIILVSIVMINQFLDIRPTADGFLPFSFLMFLQLFCTPFCLTLFLFLLTCVLSLLLNHFILLLRSNEKWKLLYTQNSAFSILSSGSFISVGCSGESFKICFA